jgi:hypothetical protein
MWVNAITLLIVSFASVGGTVWAAKISGKVKEVHILVNNQLDEIMTKNAALTAEVKFQKTQPAEDP